MTPEERDQKILQYLWSKLEGRKSSRISNRETLVVREIMPCLYALLPDQEERPDEDIVMTHIQAMAQRGCEGNMPDGTRVRIVEATRTDWPIGKLGFQCVAVESPKTEGGGLRGLPEDNDMMAESQRTER